MASLKYNPTMATAVEQLVIDSQSRFLEMKSLQPYSTTDEYLYAMKEDLADWLSNMYPDWCPITAENFIECLENGALLCHHANNVNDAARKHSSLSSLTNCKYRSDARAQTFNARDNVSQFIKWSRRVACVREVLMFESDDLILRKNEKNFILCLLEIARFGAKFGISVPAIIKLEVEIEREIERDKQTGILSFTELKRLQREEEEENQENKLNLIDDNDDDHQTNKNSFSVSDSDGANLLKQRLTNIQTFSDDNSKRRQNSDENYDDTTSNEVTTTIITSNEEQEFNRTFEEEEDKDEKDRTELEFSRTTEEKEKPIDPKFIRTTAEKEKPIVPPASSSHLHKTVVHITSACCCSQRFPVIRIGEGKYRIGENGTIIFIRILRNHVMVRVGGGWDTLENYLNKHDPCRRSGGHRRSEHHNHNHHHHHSDIPILAIPNPNISPSVQKNTPYGKSVTIKTEEFPLSKPSVHDTNLVDAQLVITRGADGRHRIGQITYKSEEDLLNQPAACPHHHNHSPPPAIKTKTVRSTGRSTPLSIYNKQSSPSTDQDYSSLTETTPSKPSSSSSFDFKDEPIEQSTNLFNIPAIEDQPIAHYSPMKKSQTEPRIHMDNTSSAIKSTKPSSQKSDHLKPYKPSITESIIDNIDPLSIQSKYDFDINDIQDVMELNKKAISDEDKTNMDNDSLDSSEGVLEEKKKPSLPPTARKSSGYSSARYMAQKQKFQQEQADNRKRSSSNNTRYSSRLSTLPIVVGGTKKEETVNKPRRKPLPVTQRSKSSELIDKINDISKLDRDSGFDEQDFRRERLHSNGDDNSSVSSVKSARSSTARSVNIEYRENKSYELRMKKLEVQKNSNEKESTLKTSRNLNTTPRRGSDAVPSPSTTATTNKYRKNSQPVVNLK